MISKLFAQEFRMTRKSLFTSIGVLVLFALLALAAAALRIPVLGELGLGGGVISIVIVLPLTFGVLAENYWRTMYGKEGYFTMTLPVRGRDLFTAKVLYGLAASVAAAVVGALLALALSITLALMNGQPAFSTVQTFFKELAANLELVGPAMVIFVVASIVLFLTYTIVAGAALMSIGAEGRFNHLGFGAPVLGGVITYVAMQVLGFAAMLFIPLGVRIIGPDAGSFVAEGMFSGFVASVTDPSGQTQPEVIGVGIVFVSLIVTVLFAWRGARSVERHTSLR